MPTTTITIPVDADTAHLYAEAPDELRQKLGVMLGLWLREYASSPHALQAVMDAASQKAQARGLTPEILDDLLRAE